MSETVFVHHKRRNVELILVLLSAAISIAALLSTHLAIHDDIPANTLQIAGVWVGLCVAAHLAVRFILPYADPVILPVILLLNGLGLVMIHRLDLDSPKGQNGDAPMQLIWTGLSIVCFLFVLLFGRSYKSWQRFPYLMFILGLGLLLLPLVPGLGNETSAREFGARIWIHVGPFSFQPGEIAKIVLAIAFASYLVEHRDVLSLAGKRFLGIDLPRPRDLGPILVMWIASILVLVFETDLGSSLLFFGLFVVMLYVATERPSWPILGTLMFAAAAVLGYFAFGHVRRRVNAWLTPFDDYDHNFQVIQAQFGMDWGGLLGRGLGLGSPWMVPLAKSDMIATSLFEELGLVGFMAIVLLYGILSARGLKAALAARGSFGKLLAVGLTFAFTLQVFAILGGVTRLLPLTGLTTPFMSQGGSALLSNWILMGILLAISHDGRRPLRATPAMTTTVADLADEGTVVLPAGALSLSGLAMPTTARTSTSAESPATLTPPAGDLP